MNEKLVGYKLTRTDCNGWMFAGTTPKEVAATLANELDLNEGLPDDLRLGPDYSPYRVSR